jgi:hypothetical protein
MVSVDVAGHCRKSTFQQGARFKPVFIAPLEGEIRRIMVRGHKGKHK